MTYNRKSDNAVLNNLYVSNSTKADFPTLKYRRDNVSGVIYHGYAKPGSGSGIALWLIAKETGTGGNLDFADGDLEFDNIWKNRTSLTYS